MYRRLVFLLALIPALFLLSLSLRPNGQPIALAAEQAATSGNLPRAVLVQPVFDFGSVRQGTHVQHEFTLKNAGTAPLKIQRMHTSCGCTAAVIDSDTIAPNAETQIRTTFDTSGFQGAKIKTIRLYTNDPKQPSVLLSLQGSVQPDVEISVSRIHFGDIRRGDTPTLKLTVTASSALGIKIEDAVTRSQFVQLNTEDVTLGDKVGKRITVQLKEGLPLGLFRDRIVVRTSSGNNPVINVPVMARVQGDVRLNPSIVSFGLIDVNSQKELSQVVKVVTPAGVPAKILSVESDSAAVSGEAFEDGSGVGIKVTVKPEITGAFRARLKVSTENADPEQRQLVLPVYGIVSRVAG